uniref:BED-type domain-containing protein n=1 Tax=Nothobranchius kuhntae TaxID=321403 RepID=A0A1A8JG95_NOTKU
MAEQEEIRKKNRSDKTEEKPRTKTSRVWEHFTLDAMKRRVTCKICKNHLAWHGSTTSLSEHLRRKHVGADAAEEEHRGQVSRHLEEPARKKTSNDGQLHGERDTHPPAIHTTYKLYSKHAGKRHEATIHGGRSRLPANAKKLFWTDILHCLAHFLLLTVFMCNKIDCSQLHNSLMFFFFLTEMYSSLV